MLDYFKKLIPVLICALLVGGLYIEKEVHHMVYQFRMDGEESYRVLRVMGGAATEAHQASKEQRQFLKEQMPLVVSDMRVVTGKMSTTIDSMNTMVVHSDTQLQEVMEHSKTLLHTSNQAVLDLDDQIKLTGPFLASWTSLGEDLRTRVNSSDLTGTFRNVNRITTAAALSMEDFQRWEHDHLFPPPYTGRFKKLRVGWFVIKNLLPLSEPAYYTVQLGKGK